MTSTMITLPTCNNSSHSSNSCTTSPSSSISDEQQQQHDDDDDDVVYNNNDHVMISNNNNNNNNNNNTNYHHNNNNMIRKRHTTTANDNSNHDNDNNKNNTSDSYYNSINNNNFEKNINKKNIQEEEEEEAATASSSSTSLFRRISLWYHNQNGFIKFILFVWIWPMMCTLPMILTTNVNNTPIYQQLFPADWYMNNDTREHPHILGLCLGISAVITGQIGILLFFYIYKYHYIIPNNFESLYIVQRNTKATYDFKTSLFEHLFQPEGFLLLGAYLTITWYYNLLPSSYYNFNGTIQYHYVLACLLVQDLFQYIMHRLEHVTTKYIYSISHKPHHRYINPNLFHAFHGSVLDTIGMILIPLYITANICNDCNVWTYMVFGSIYANWLCLLHSEYILPYDHVFVNYLKFGTCIDHHIHHKYYIYNYGHLFLYWDIIFHTYRNPYTFYYNNKTNNNEQQIREKVFNI